MKPKALITAGLIAAMAAAPISSASAHDRGFRGHDPLLLPFIAVGALVAGVAIIATAPIRAVADAASYDDGPRYAAPPQGYASQGYAPQAYAPPPAYYAPRYASYYAPQPVYYAPRYYSGPQGYYNRRPYY